MLKAKIEERAANDGLTTSDLMRFLATAYLDGRVTIADVSKNDGEVQRGAEPTGRNKSAATKGAADGKPNGKHKAGNKGAGANRQRKDAGVGAGGELFA